MFGTTSFGEKSIAEGPDPLEGRTGAIVASLSTVSKYAGPLETRPKIQADLNTVPGR